MISKVHHASSLDAMLRYVYQEAKSPQVISNTTMGRDMAGARQEILGEIKKHEALKRPVFHGILSLPIEESLTRTQWRRVVERYTGAMGYASSAYVAVRHFDTDHEHVHIVASRIDVSGAVVEDSLEWVRSQEILREIEREFGLQIVPNAWEVDERRMGQAEYHSLQEGKALESDREGARAAIYAALGEAESVEDFVATLGAHGVSIIPRVEPTGEVMGLAFKSGERFFAGHRVSRAYSWPRLKEKIGYEHARDFDALVRAPAVIERSTPAPEAKALVRESREDLLGGEGPPRLGRVPEPAREESAPSRADVLAPDRQRAPLARVPEGRQGAPAFVARPVPVLSQDEEADRAKREELLALARDPMVARTTKRVEGYWCGAVREGSEHLGVIERVEGGPVVVRLADRLYVGDAAYDEHARSYLVKQHEGLGALREGDIVSCWSAEGETALTRAGELHATAKQRVKLLKTLAGYEAKGLEVRRGVQEFDGLYVGHYSERSETHLVLRRADEVGVVSLGMRAHVGDAIYSKEGATPREEHGSLERFEAGDRVVCSVHAEVIHVARLLSAKKERVEVLRAEGWRVVDNEKRVQGTWDGAYVDEKKVTWGLVLDERMRRVSAARLDEPLRVWDASYDARAVLVPERECVGVSALTPGDVVTYQRVEEGVALLRTTEREEQARERAAWPERLRQMERTGRAVVEREGEASGTYRGHYTGEGGERWLLLQGKTALERVRVPHDARVGDAVYAEGQGAIPRSEHGDVGLFREGDTIVCATRGEEVHVARLIDEKEERLRALGANSRGLDQDAKKVEGFWDGAYVDKNGERWGIVRDGDVSATVKLDDKTLVGDGEYDPDGKFRAARQHENTSALERGDLVKYWRVGENSALVRASEREHVVRQRVEVSRQLEVAKREGLTVSREHEEASGLYRARFVDSRGQDWLVLEREQERVLVLLPEGVRVGDVVRREGEYSVNAREDRLVDLKPGDRLTFEKAGARATLLREEKRERDSVPHASEQKEVPLHLGLASGRRIEQAMRNDAGDEFERVLRLARLKMEQRDGAREVSPKPEQTRPDGLEHARASKQVSRSERASLATNDAPGEKPSKPERSARVMEEGEKIKGVVSAQLVMREERAYRVVRAKDEDVLVPEKSSIARLEGEKAHVEAFRLPNGEMGHAARGIDLQRDMGRDRTREKP